MHLSVCAQTLLGARIKLWDSGHFKLKNLWKKRLLVNDKAPKATSLSPNYASSTLLRNYTLERCTGL